MKKTMLATLVLGILLVGFSGVAFAQYEYKSYNISGYVTYEDGGFAEGYQVVVDYRARVVNNGIPYTWYGPDYYRSDEDGLWSKSWLCHYLDNIEITVNGNTKTYSSSDFRDLGNNTYHLNVNHRILNPGPNIAIAMGNKSAIESATFGQVKALYR